MNQPEISIVSPVYQAETLIDELVERICQAVKQISPNYEIILIEDGGTDNSWQKIKENCAKNRKVRGIKLSRNFGQQHAIQAGLDASCGKYIVTMDCDLQDRPEEIIQLYQKAKSGYQIVAARRINRQDPIITKFLSRIFYWILEYLTETKQDKSIANFVIYERTAVDALAQLKDRKRYYPLLLQWIGFHYTHIDIEHAERADGNSSYSFQKRLRLAVDTILFFSDKPLRLAITFGTFLSFLSLTAMTTLVILYFLNGTVENWINLAFLISFFSGIIISVVGMAGLYIGQTFETVKKRPTYIIHETVNKS